MHKTTHDGPLTGVHLPRFLSYMLIMLVYITNEGYNRDDKTKPRGKSKNLSMTSRTIVIAVVFIFFFTTVALRSGFTQTYSQSSRLRMSSSSLSPPRNIQVFTRPGCKYCRIAKAKLNELGVPYEEYDISAVSTDKSQLNSLIKERLAYTLTTTVPQIYIGSDLIGGCDNLLKEVETNTFENRLQLYNIQKLIKIAHTTTNDATSTSAGDLTSTTNTRVKRPLGDSLNDYLDFHPLPEILSLTPTQLSQQLQRSILQLCDIYVTSDGKQVNYAKMSQSQEFEKYIELSNYLKYYSIKELALGLKDNQKFSFFVNIYNAMIIHRLVYTAYIIYIMYCVVCVNICMYVYMQHLICMAYVCIHVVLLYYTYTIYYLIPWICICTHTYI